LGERGDGSFEDFYERSFEAVARAVMLAVGDREDARDLTQEAFVRTWARWGQLRQPLLFTLKAARNLATSRIRRLIRERAAIPRLWEAEPDSADGGASLSVRAALAGLPDRQRWAVVLCDFLQMSSTEAAPILALSPSTVRVHLARAHERLRQALGEGEEALDRDDRAADQRG
jgi:RNA polymerase sigma-70 factor, ECF subfamily